MDPGSPRTPWGARDDARRGVAAWVKQHRSKSMTQETSNAPQNWGLYGDQVPDKVESSVGMYT
jgi:hypothetical protein